MLTFYLNNIKVLLIKSLFLTKLNLLIKIPFVMLKKNKNLVSNRNVTKFFLKQKNFVKNKFLIKIKKNINLTKLTLDSAKFNKLLKKAKNFIITFINFDTTYGFLYIKSSGINSFFTLTNVKKEVFFICQAECLKMSEKLKIKNL